MGSMLDGSDGGLRWHADHLPPKLRRFDIFSQLCVLSRTTTSALYYHHPPLRLYDWPLSFWSVAGQSNMPAINTYSAGVDDPSASPPGGWLACKHYQSPHSQSASLLSHHFGRCAASHYCFCGAVFACLPLVFSSGQHCDVLCYFQGSPSIFFKKKNPFSQKSTGTIGKNNDCH